MISKMDINPCNAQMMMVKEQNRYMRAMIKKWCNEHFQVAENVWKTYVDFSNWWGRWIGRFAVKKILHTNVYVLDIDTNGTKKWQLIFHIFLLKFFYRDEKIYIWGKRIIDLHPIMNFRMAKWKNHNDFRFLTNRKQQTILMLNAWIFAL